MLDNDGDGALTDSDIEYGDNYDNEPESSFVNVAHNNVVTNILPKNSNEEEVTNDDDENIRNINHSDLVRHTILPMLEETMNEENFNRFQLEVEQFLWKANDERKHEDYK